MAVYGIVVESTGWTGGPGFNTYYFNGVGEPSDTVTVGKATAAATLVRDFLVGLSSGIDSAINMQILPDVIARDWSNGNGLQTIPVTQAAVVGADVSGDLLPTPTCAVINWRTATFGPRGRGRQFITGIDEDHNTSTGQPASSITTDFNSAASAFVTASLASADVRFVVWSRPVKAGDPPVVTRAGLVSNVTSGTMKTQWGILRSRRD